MKEKNNAAGCDRAGAAKVARTDSSILTTKWLIGMFGVMEPSYFADEIPERDLQMADAAGSAAVRDQTGEGNAARAHSNWKLVAAVSGFTAACSAAVTGVVVFACMRHFHSFDSV